jgi:hypothetical protein
MTNMQLIPICKRVSKHPNLLDYDSTVYIVVVCYVLLYKSIQTVDVMI